MKDGSPDWVGSEGRTPLVDSYWDSESWVVVRGLRLHLAIAEKTIQSRKRRQDRVRMLRAEGIVDRLYRCWSW